AEHHRHRQGVEQAHLDGQAESLAGERAGAAPAAGCVRPPPEAEIYDAGKGPAAGLHDLLHAPRCGAGTLSALPDERIACRFRYAGRADPHPYASLGKSLRIKEEAEVAENWNLLSAGGAYLNLQKYECLFRRMTPAAAGPG